jgi:hypothetical protein
VKLQQMICTQRRGLGFCFVLFNQNTGRLRIYVFVSSKNQIFGARHGGAHF